MKLVKVWRMEMKHRTEFIMIGKALFFPDSGILALGDLQLGYETMLLEGGISMPFNQVEQSKKDLEEILREIKERKMILKKIVILGDVKHHFGFNVKEKFAVRDFIEFLDLIIGKENLILIRGNHEKFELDNRKYLDYYVHENTAFLHGHKEFLEIYGRKIKSIVLAHLHPAVIISDSSKGGVKKERYKCFLVGKFKGKKTIILPSFFPMIEGTCLNQEIKYEKQKRAKEFSIIPEDKLGNFSVYIPDKKGKILDFGKLKNLP
jgi:putative SbcD/Mre11-related phosphoesterase